LLGCDPTTPDDATIHEARAQSEVEPAARSSEAASPATLASVDAPLPVHTAPTPTASPEEAAAVVASLEFSETRAGTLRITDPRLNDPSLVAPLAERLAAGEGSPEQRRALAEALPRTGGRFGPAVAAQLGDETDAGVRVQLIATLRRASAESALPALRSGFSDPDASVVTQAAITAGSRADGAELEEQLLGGLESGEASVRRESARALGVLRIDAESALRALESDPDASVREAAAQALAR
jgi:hypothetical protein